MAVHLAAARPDLVTLLVIVEGSMDDWGDEQPFDGQTEEQFLADGFGRLVAALAEEARADPGSVAAAHLGMTALLEPRAVFREAVSMAQDTDPPVRSVLSRLTMPRWYLQGERSDPEPEFQRDLEAMGVRWRVVPDTGHAMGLQNPAGLAAAVAEMSEMAPSD